MFDWLSSDATIKFVECLESAIIIVGAIIGSSWAVFTFIAQRRNWLVKKQPLIKLNLRVEQRWLPDDPSFYLHIIVEATNDGNVVDYMHYSGDDHLSVTRYHIDAKGERVSTEKIVRVLERTKGRKVNFNTLHTRQHCGASILGTCDRPRLVSHKILLSAKRATIERNEKSRSYSFRK